MKILFLGYPDSPLIDFIREEGDSVTVVAADEKISSSFVREQGFEFLISYGYLHILKDDILRLFPNRAINLHIAFLPFNRGKDPNFWSFVEGTPKGVTLHCLDAGVDTGDILVQKEVVFGDKETLKSSYALLRQTLETLFCEHWQVIQSGDYPRKKQKPGGSFHLAKEKERFAFLLEEGWDTPVSKLTLYGRAHNLCRKI